MKQGRSTLSAIFLSAAMFFAPTPVRTSSAPDMPEPLPVSVTPENDDRGLDKAVKSAWKQALALSGEDMPDPKTVCYNDVPDLSKSPIIVLDPGHGGINSRGRVDVGGAINRSHGLVEMEIIDKVVEALQSNLEADGYDVVTTRDPGQPLTHAQGDYGASLSLRPFLAFYLGKETGRPVIFLSVHVDNTRPGGAVYLQRTPLVSAGKDSESFAKDLAESYKIGNRATVIPNYRHNYRVLRNFEWLDRHCSFEGVSALLELGSANDAQDIPHLKEMLRYPEKAAEKIAKGIKEFVGKNYGVPVTKPFQDNQKPANDTPSPGLTS